MILQLDPMIPMMTPKGKGFAFLVLDYSQEHHLLFTVALTSGEIWTFPSTDLRFQNNFSLERNAVLPF